MILKRISFSLILVGLAAASIAGVLLVKENHNSIEELQEAQSHQTKQSQILLAAQGKFENRLQAATISIQNSSLANSSINIVAGTGLLGGGSVDLGEQTKLSLPQNISPDSRPQFSGLSLGSALETASGGTGRMSFPSNALLLGNGTNAIDTITAKSSGQILLSDKAGLPHFVSLSGDATLSDAGVLTLTSNPQGSNSGITQLNSLTGGVSLVGAGINTISTSGNTITVSATELDTLASVTARGSTTSSPLALSGGLALNGGLLTQSISALSPKSLLADIGSPFSVSIQDNFAYVADQANLRIVDITDPANPTLISTFPIGSSSWGVKAMGNYAYVAATNQLVILDISNPFAPVQIGSLAISGTLFDVDINGKYAYATQYGYGLRIVDISNPAAPTLVGSTATGNHLPYQTTVAGKYAYVADNNVGFSIIDVSDPSHPTFTALSNNTCGNVRGVDIAGRYLYTTGAGNSCIFDISNPASPSFISSFNQKGYRVSIAGRYAYVSSGASSYRVYDISNPATPSLVATYSGGTVIISSQIVGKFAYLADYAGLRILEIEGADFSAISTGSISTGSLNVVQNTSIGGSLSVKDSVTIGQNGLRVGGESAFDTNTSTTVLKVIQRGSGDVLSVSTSLSSLFVIKNNGNIGIGTSTPGASSILDISSTTKGVVLPRMTKAQRDAIASPVAGMAVYQIDNVPGLRVYNGTNWMRYSETAD